MSIPSALPILRKNPIIPVVVIDNVEDAVPTVKALKDGGIKAIEITFRTPVAAQCVREAAGDSEIIVGAGTIISPKQAQVAVAAGAKFLVSPGFTPEIADIASELEVPYLPGITNPSDIMQTFEYKIDTLKFFPAIPLGGLSFLKAMSAPFANLKFMPTGGIGKENLGQWLSEPSVISVGGSWMAKREMINSGQFSEITRLSREAIELAKEYLK